MDAPTKTPVADPTDSTALHLDREKYEAQLAAFDLDETEKAALLGALYQIALNFVDLGFGLHPAQQACGPSSKIPPKPTPTAENSLYWSYSTLGERFDQAGSDADPGKEEVT